jgi:hypothetical protein
MKKSWPLDATPDFKFERTPIRLDPGVGDILAKTILLQVNVFQRSTSQFERSSISR